MAKSLTGRTEREQRCYRDVKKEEQGLAILHVLVCRKSTRERGPPHGHRLSQVEGRLKFGQASKAQSLGKFLLPCGRSHQAQAAGHLEESLGSARVCPLCSDAPHGNHLWGTDERVWTCKNTVAPCCPAHPGHSCRGGI